MVIVIVVVVVVIVIVVVVVVVVVVVIIAPCATAFLPSWDDHYKFISQCCRSAS